MPVKGTAKAIAVSLHIKLQPGTGQVSCQVKGSEDFKDAVGRAQSAMRERGFLFEEEDLLYTLDLTDARYERSSFGLAAAVAMHDVKLNLATDAYTAFTGDINLDGQEWTIKPVSGADAFSEELYFDRRPAADRGWALVLVDTPGRGSSIYVKGIPSRPTMKFRSKLASTTWLRGLSWIRIESPLSA